MPTEAIKHLHRCVVVEVAMVTGQFCHFKLNTAIFHHVWQNHGSYFVGWQVRELGGELESEQRRHADAQKTVRRHERRIQELTQISEDEEKARDAEREIIDKLQSKLKQYKLDLDDAVSYWTTVVGRIVCILYARSHALNLILNGVKYLLVATLYTPQYKPQFTVHFPAV